MPFDFISSDDFGTIDQRNHATRCNISLVQTVHYALFQARNSKNTQIHQKQQSLLKTKEVSGFINVFLVFFLVLILFLICDVLLNYTSCSFVLYLYLYLCICCIHFHEGTLSSLWLKKFISCLWPLFLFSLNMALQCRKN